MKNLYKMLSVAVLVVASANLYAERDSGFYVGAKTGILEADAGDFDIDDDNPIAIVGGYDFGGLAIQGEYYSAENAVKGTPYDIESDVLAVYGVYRTDGFVYFMGKAGVVQGDSEVGGLSDDDTAFSYGLGVGLNFSDTFEVEAEYLIYEIEDVDVEFLAITAILKF